MTKRRVFVSLCTAVCMSMCMSLAMTIINVGFVERFFLLWLRAWGIAFVVTAPLAFFVPPLVQKLADKLKLK